MYKKCMSLSCVVVLSIFATSCVSSAYAEEKPSILERSHLVKELLINKKAFDDVIDLIIRTVSHLPECKWCPADKIAALNFEKAGKKLEKINEKLKYLLSDTDGLEPNEKAAVLTIYSSIVDNALTTKMILENLIAPFLEDQMYKALPPPPPSDAAPSWVAGAFSAVVLLGLFVDTGSDGRDAICLRDTPEEECRAAGCSWCWDYEGTCGAEVDANGQSLNPCCGYFNNEYECGGVQYCTWTPMYSSGYCSNRCPPVP